MAGPTAAGRRCSRARGGGTARRMQPWPARSYQGALLTLQLCPRPPANRRRCAGGPRSRCPARQWLNNWLQADSKHRPSYFVEDRSVLRCLRVGPDAPMHSSYPSSADSPSPKLIQSGRVAIIMIAALSHRAHFQHNSFHGIRFIGGLLGAHLGPSVHKCAHCTLGPNGHRPTDILCTLGDATIEICVHWIFKCALSVLEVCIAVCTGCNTIEHTESDGAHEKQNL